MTKGEKFIAKISLDIPPFPKSALEYPIFLGSIIWTIITEAIKSRINGVRSAFIVVTLEGNDIGSIVYEKFLLEALERKKFIAAPDPEVVGKGLDFVQEAMDLNKKGVSAKKLVVTL